VRRLLALALLGITASCIAPPPEAAAPPQPVALAPTPPPQPVALAPTPAPAAALQAVPIAPPPPPPGPVAAFYAPNPWLWLFPAFAFAPEPGPGRVTLNNFSFDGARVQAIVTPFPDCQERPGASLSEFEIPLNGTRIIDSPVGADVCWRRALPQGPSPTRPGVEIVSGWTEWSRVFTSSGRSIDSRL